ncbi:MAG: YcxB family protein [Lachnospiraceae bacterium]|nr:YcxB family protein [Lachnospiraceae bacterium]
MSDKVETHNEELDINELDGIRFSVQMTWKEIYKFTMRHNYFSLAGFIGTFLSVAALVILIVYFGQLSDRDKTVLTIVAIWFLVFLPVRLLFRSKTQVKLSKAYAKPLNYIVGEKGITVSQDEESQTIEWGLLYKIVETKSQYIVYSNRINAFIFPKNSIGEQADELGNVMANYVKGKSVKLCGGMKKRKA